MNNQESSNPYSANGNPEPNQGNYYQQTPPPHQNFNEGPAYGGNPYGPSQGGYGNRPHYKPDNYLILSIISTVFCCFPLGIVAVYYASKVDNYYFNGDYAAAVKASEKAKIWSIVSIVSSALLIVLYLASIFIFGFGLISSLYTLS